MKGLKNTNTAKRIFGLLHLPVLLALLLASCSNDINGTDASGSSADGKTYISISAQTTQTRSLAPRADDYSTEKLTSLKLTGRLISETTADEETILAETEIFSKLSGKNILVEAGNWLLTLSATLNGVTFYGETRAEIEKGKINPISFTLTPETSYGGMSITVEFTGEADKVSVSLKKAGNEELLAGSELTPVQGTDGKKSVTFSRSASDEAERLESGSYYLLFEFFGLEGIGRLNTVENIVRVKEGITTTAKLTLDLNEIYTITYETNDGVPESTDDILTNKYSRKSETITLPQMKKAGCIFKGWYESSDTDYANPLEYIDSSRASDLTLVAYFEKILSNLYVTARTLEDGETDTGDGSEVNPFASISSALAQINEYASNTTDYTIVLSGEFVAMQELSSSLDGKAKSITLTGKTGNTTDILNGDIGGNNYHTLRVATTVPVTISNLKITGGRCGLSLGYDEENSADVQVDVTLDDGALVTDNGNSSGINLSAGKLTLKGGSITNNCCEYGGGVAVTGGEFVMESGTIGGTEEGEANTADYRGAGVYITGGTFTMKGGTICGNKSSSSASGAGVYVGYDEDNGTVGTFIMQGGTISANEAVTAGGGVFVDGSSTSLTDSVTFTMRGGTISGNKESSTATSGARGGGGVALYGEHAQFTMEDGIIRKNQGNRFGGGVSLVESATFIMTGGLIGDTSSTSYGNYLYLNTENKYGSAVFVADSAIFTMDGGEISYNYNNGAAQGAYGTVCAYSGTFNMKGGIICHNNVLHCGGAVYIYYQGICNLEGGTIRDNICEDSKGSGVYIKKFNNDFGTLNMSGSAVIESGNDIYLPSGTSFALSGELTGDAPIATITPQSYSTDTTVLTLADGADTTLAAEYEKFAVTKDSSNPDTPWRIKADGTLTNLIGEKSASDGYAVGDIVFNDGSATSYTSSLTLTDVQKTAAIALIFYKGTDLNSDDAEDTTAVRTLGVGLKHNKSLVSWCRSSAEARSTNITTIQCPPSGTDRQYTFEGDKNGSDNLEQIAAFLGENNDTGVGENSTKTKEEAAALYPAFYFAKNYKDVSGSNVSGTAYEEGWYLPSIAELFQVYVNGRGSSKVFDIDAASQALGGDTFGSSYYWSSSQSNEGDGSAYDLFLDSGRYTGDGCYKSIDKYNGSMAVCCIREF